MLSLFTFGIALLSIVLLAVFKSILGPYTLYSKYKSETIIGYFFPIFGLHRLLRKNFAKTGDVWGFYKELPKEQPDVRAHVHNTGNRVVLQLLDPKLLKEFFAHQHYYHKIPFPKTFQDLVGTGLLSAEGKLWKQHRKILSNMFHYEFLKQNLPVIASTAQEFLDELAKRSLENVDIMDEIQKITGEIVGRIFFGENLNNYTMNGELLTLYLANLLGDIFRDQRRSHMVIIRMTGMNPYVFSSFRKIMARVEEFRALCSKIVNDRKASKIKAHDMLGLMLETQNNPNKEEAFSDEDIVNEFITFFAAGMDTTGHSISMALYLLAKQPEYKKDFEEEIKKVYEKEQSVTQDTLGQMEFINAVLKETLRMYSPVSGTSSRIAQEDHKLLDIPIKKGMNVKANPIYNCFHPRYFDEPECFKPERWLNKSSTVDPFVYVPFASGSRNCIGQHLSIIESKIILAEFFKRFDYELPKDYKLRMTLGFLYEPVDKLTFKLIPKKQ